ncbi:MAG: 4Fe-4S binding protein [Nitrospinae bacterium]|nr:4Fe-4S binding protein [Nitrospinota bacterium]
MKYLHDVATLVLFSEKCTGCGMCAEVCPRGVFAITNKRAVITDKDLCMECGACALNCEYSAITVNAGVGCASAIIGGMIGGGPATCGCGGDSPKTGCC